ncbi:hypothetical protein MCHIJ_36810 [Mycolicibacterium chitae]|nr:hypothetical protein MCHIJ_36810 [Mycolicibacterium chitae]
MRRRWSGGADSEHEFARTGADPGYVEIAAISFANELTVLADQPSVMSTHRAIAEEKYRHCWNAGTGRISRAGRLL